MAIAVKKLELYMNSPLTKLFTNNRAWAAAQKQRDPNFFSNLSTQQQPDYLWIGCSDSRVPANEIVGLAPGDIFVHRNIANVIPHSDSNVLSVIEFAIDVLAIKHIIVTGHYNCGGIRTALSQHSIGLIDNWLAHIKDIYGQHVDEINTLPTLDARTNRLAELNVKAQVLNVARTSIVQKAWQAGKMVNIHGWIYALDDGLLDDLEVTISAPHQLPEYGRLVLT